MLFKIIILAICVIAITLTFKSEWILTHIFKISEPSEKAIIIVKIIALILAILLFAAVFRV